MVKLNNLKPRKPVKVSALQPKASKEQVLLAEIKDMLEGTATKQDLTAVTNKQAEIEQQFLNKEETPIPAIDEIAQQVTMLKKYITEVAALLAGKIDTVSSDKPSYVMEHVRDTEGRLVKTEVKAN